VQDLHPADRGPQGTHDGTIICNGSLYCPATPQPLLELIPLKPGATIEETTAHDAQTAELARHKLGVHAAQDADGYRRLACPAVMGKIRCPLRPASMTLSRDRPEILAPPGHPPACCTQQTITAGPDVAAKTRQKHDYPSAEWRRSYSRRTAAERLNSTVKDTATTSIARGWIRLTGLPPVMLWLACLIAVRNQRILVAWDTRQQDNARRAAAGLPPRTRKRRRRALAGAARAALTSGNATVSALVKHQHRNMAQPRPHARRQPPPPRTCAPETRSSTPAAPQAAGHARQQTVRPKCEHQPWGSVNTSGCAARDLNPEPAD
jgi:hypothetical protein